MKTKYFLVAALSLAIMTACNSKNEPDKSNNSNNNEQEVTELADQLGDLFDGLGNIVSTETLPDGSIVTRDDKGNTATTDKDGNTTIVTGEGTTITIDNCINEDATAPKDKWSFTTWEQIINQPLDPVRGPERIPEIINVMRAAGCQVESENFSEDRNYTNTSYDTERTIHFYNTTGALQEIEKQIKESYTRTYNYIKYTFTEQQVGDGEIRYELEVTDDAVILTQVNYEYNSQSGEYVENDRWEVNSLRFEHFDKHEGHSIYLYQGEELKESNEEIISSEVRITMFNFRRLSDTQMAANNNTQSFILKEAQVGDIPRLDAFDLNTDHGWGSFRLVSL